MTLHLSLVRFRGQMHEGQLASSALVRRAVLPQEVVRECVDRCTLVAYAVGSDSALESELLLPLGEIEAGRAWHVERHTGATMTQCCVEV